MSVLVRRNPAPAVLEIVAGGLFLLFFVYTLAVGVPTAAGCLVLVAPVALIVDGARRLHNREYLSYNPQSRTMLVSAGQQSTVYRAQPGERFVVADGRVAIVGADGGHRELPVRESRADRADWRLLVTAISG